jgi:hypothetical protein
MGVGSSPMVTPARRQSKPSGHSVNAFARAPEANPGEVVPSQVGASKVAILQHGVAARRHRLRHPRRRARRPRPAIRKAREAGLEQARLRRIAYHRANPTPDPTVHPSTACPRSPAMLAHRTGTWIANSETGHLSATLAP